MLACKNNASQKTLQDMERVLMHGGGGGGGGARYILWRRRKGTCIKYVRWFQMFLINELHFSSKEVHGQVIRGRSLYSSIQPARN